MGWWKRSILHMIGDIGVDGALYRAMEINPEKRFIKNLPMYGGYDGEYGY